MHPAARHLVFHGAIVLLFGLLLGAPYAKAIKREAAAHVVNSWRVAHLSLPIGATLMLATAAPGTARDLVVRLSVFFSRAHQLDPGSGATYQLAGAAWLWGASPFVLAALAAGAVAVLA